MAYEVARPLVRCPSHPGALLNELIPDTGITKVKMAEMLQISRQQLQDITAEKKPISPTVAAKLGKLFGDGAAVWLRMQAAYDAWHAENNMDLSEIPTLETT